MQKTWCVAFFIALVAMEHIACVDGINVLRNIGTNRVLLLRRRNFIVQCCFRQISCYGDKQYSLASSSTDTNIETDPLTESVTDTTVATENTTLAVFLNSTSTILNAVSQTVGTNYIVTTSGIISITGVGTTVTTLAGIPAATAVGTNTASVVGTISVVSGTTSIATVGTSTATLVGTTTNVKASTTTLSTIGTIPSATQSSSTTMKTTTTASGSTTTASGSTTTASGSTTTASGSTTTASGSTTTASGSTTTASSSTTTASGSTTTASGSTTTASGSTTTASGTTTTASGSTTTASGTTTTASSSTTTTTSTTTTIPMTCESSFKCEIAACKQSADDKAAALAAIPPVTENPATLPLTDIGGKYYFLDKTRLKSYADALLFCRYYGMDLVSIESEQEQTDISAFLTAQGLAGSWVITSGNKIGERCEYMWENGDPLAYQPMTYTNWLAGQPATLTLEDCLMLILGKWLDVYCSAVTFFMCEQKADQIITTTVCPLAVCSTAACDATNVNKMKALNDIPSPTSAPGSLPLVNLDGTYYYLDKTQTLAIHDALKFCRSNGMDLVSVETQSEQDAINAHLQSLGILANMVITSGNKIGSRCKYMWQNGDPLTWKEMTYTNWAPGEPATPDSFQCMMMTNGKWTDEPCNTVTYFMCEQLPGQTITLSG